MAVHVPQERWTPRQRRREGTTAKTSKSLGIRPDILPSALGTGALENSMGAHVHPQDPLSPPAGPTSRSFLSMLATPLRPRTRNLADFYIQPDEPHRQYSPGDTVKGIVVLAVIKPIRLTHLTVALHGFVRVYKNQNGANDATTDVTNTGTSRRVKYLGNGHASLFQDEIILCADGRLDVGVYEFEFNLEFPKRGLPSSIDFERGTISYMIRSTITRPTSIAATTSCDMRITLVEDVDVGPMVAPEPRVISLEPISIRPKKHAKSKSKVEKTPTEAAQQQDIRHSAESTAAEDSASPCDSADHVPRSPRSVTNFDVNSQSEHSSNNSFISNSTGMMVRFAQAPAMKCAPRSQVGQSNGSPTNGTITATIELLKAGCLPGDSVSVRISIQHTKWMKSLHGIIITLYRQARIDFAPPLSLFSDLKGKDSERLKHEEYYPKSKTGLGGLSLTSAGSSSVFRKDLSQTFAPIIIDPITLSTVVTASLKVPEDLFPTIKGVPGEMISFKYHIEVVIDLGGKLAGQDRHMPRLGLITLPSMTNSSGLLATDASSSGTLATGGVNIVNTDHVRRDKSVVACLFELVVGTTDTARLRGRGNLKTKQVIDDIPASPRSYSSRHDHFEQQDARTPSPTEQHIPYQQDHQDMEQYYEHEDHYGYYNEYDDQTSMHQNPHYNYGVVPPPEMQAEENLNEKERVRRAEERFLPSQPPQGEHDSSRTLAPSAPGIDEDPEDLYSADATSVTHVNTTSTLTATAPSAPALEDSASNGQPTAMEDKQELERRRLMAEASSPADFPSEDNNAGEGSSTAAERIGSRLQHEATAPILTEEDEYEQDATTTQTRETLPRYERYV